MLKAQRKQAKVYIDQHRCRTLDPLMSGNSQLKLKQAHDRKDLLKNVLLTRRIKTLTTRQGEGSVRTYRFNSSR
jgi:hypothetical protein